MPDHGNPQDIPTRSAIAPTGLTNPTAAGTAPASGSASDEGAKSATVRTFMLAIMTDTGPRMIAFRLSNVLVGRLPDNHLSLNHSSISRRHARISVTTRGVHIEDMGSQNGVTVNGTLIKQPTPIRPGDVLRIGHVPMYYFGFISMEKPPAPELVENTIVVNPVLPQLN